MWIYRLIVLLAACGSVQAAQAGWNEAIADDWHAIAALVVFALVAQFFLRMVKFGIVLIAAAMLAWFGLHWLDPGPVEVSEIIASAQQPLESLFSKAMPHR